MSEPSPAEPGWKRNGRNGPFDWWLGCETHGYDYERSCLSCGIVEDHNIEFQAKLESERAAALPSYACVERAAGKPACPRWCGECLNYEPPPRSPVKGM